MPRDQKSVDAIREKSRATIIASALEEFGEKGFSDGTTAAIAARAGVSKGLVFNYFPTKEALLEALVEKCLTEVLDFWDAERWDRPPLEQLRQWIETALDQVMKRPSFYRLYFSLALQPGGSAPVNQALLKLKPRLEEHLARARSIFVALGSADPGADARLLQCTINGLAQVILTGPGFTQKDGLVPVQALRERLVQTFSRGQAGAA